MATTKLKVKTGVCKRMMKELQSYQAEADKEFVKVDNMKNSYADPFDIKQQVSNHSLLSWQVLLLKRQH